MWDPYTAHINRTLCANRQAQSVLHQQLNSVAAAKRANEADTRALAQDRKRCKHADVQVRKRGEQERRHHEQKHRDHHRQRRFWKASSYFTASDGSSPGTNQDAATPGLSLFRSMVPLVYSNVAWSKGDADKLTQAVQTYCQQQQQIALLNTGIAPDASGFFPDSYVRDQTALRDMPLRSLLDGLNIPIDWEMIAKRADFRHNAQECKIHWSAVADPRLDHREWRSDERASLRRLATNYGGHHWERISASLGGQCQPSPRTAIACCQQFQQHEKPGLVQQRAGWKDKAEDSKLMDLYEELGPQWRTIAIRLGGRTPAQCMHRYEHALKLGIKRGKWSRDEDVRLEVAVGVYQSGGGKSEPRIPWFLVARHVPGRTSPQCRDRWMNVLRVEVKAAGQWSQAEEHQLKTLVSAQIDAIPAAARAADGDISDSDAATAISWAAIAAVLHPRTDRQCKRRWKRMMAARDQLEQAD